MSKRESETMDQSVSKKLKEDSALGNENAGGDKSSHDKDSDKPEGGDKAGDNKTGANGGSVNFAESSPTVGSTASGANIGTTAGTSAGSVGTESKGTISIQPTTLPQIAKPIHGSEEWFKQRRENHKEVEKRRRESINSGIKELAALIPTSDTNKSQILQRAVEYIKRLKENETNNIEKWTLEKLLTEQAVSELDASNTKLKQELERAYREIEHYKRILDKKEE